MTMGTTIGALSSDSIAWEKVNWPACERIVKRLQTRIVKAVKEDRWNKVKTLQRLLTRSFAAKLISVKRVTGNTGKYTAGIDHQHPNGEQQNRCGKEDILLCRYEECIYQNRMERNVR